MWIQPASVPFYVDTASAGPLWIQPVLVLLADPATSYDSLCGSSQCNSLSASSQRWSPLWIQPVLVPLVDRAGDCHLCISSQCSFLSTSSQCWSPHCMQPVLVPSLSVCSQCWSPGGLSLRLSPLWIQPVQFDATLNYFNFMANNRAF